MPIQRKKKEKWKRLNVRIVRNRPKNNEIAVADARTLWAFLWMGSALATALCAHLA